MPTTSKYCKAIKREHFSEFPDFIEAVPQPNPGRAFYYLHDNFVVTRDLFVDADVVFSSVKPEWIEFCRTTLAFRPEEAMGGGSAPPIAGPTATTISSEAMK
jgi:hypothetical protein